MPPALVQSSSDLIEYYVDGSGTVQPDAPKGYSERFIHGELFKRYPAVQAVVHSHAESVQPFLVGGNAVLQPMVHMAGFLGPSVKVWDILSAYPADNYDRKVQRDMLVNTAVLGASLAEEFSCPTMVAIPSRANNDLHETVVLMKHHGYTACGPDIETAVYRAIYTLINADVQTRALTIQAALAATDSAKQSHGKSISGLDARCASDCRKMTEATQDKAWRLWNHEVEINPLYRNNA